MFLEAHAFIGAGVELSRFKYGFVLTCTDSSNLDTLMLKFVVYLKLEFNFGYPLWELCDIVSSFVKWR